MTIQYFESENNHMGISGTREIKYKKLNLQNPMEKDGISGMENTEKGNPEPDTVSK